MKVMIVGGGAREHALAWKLSQSPQVEEVFAAPGNAGTASLGHNLPLSTTDLEGIARAAQEKRIDLVVVGPEAPLALGLVDELSSRGIPAFGPQRMAAEIEWSKVFAKELMQRYGIPCAQGRAFSSFEEAEEYLRTKLPPIVVKADGLAGGKGSIIAPTLAEAHGALSKLMMEKTFGPAGERVLLEECLNGREMSFFAFTDGVAVSPTLPACDYKRALDGDRGPNTGGMGSYSPPEFFTPELGEELMEKIVRPVVKALAQEGRPYKGVLYAGLMVTSEGPKVLEFNCRFGDPETQVTLPLLKTDLMDIIQAVLDDRLGEVKIEWLDKACVGVVMASGGYPGSYKTGFPIEGLDSLDEDILVFHAGTRKEGGRVVTSGGRVLTVVARGKTLEEARAKVYANLGRINFEGCFYRKDIAKV